MPGWLTRSALGLPMFVIYKDGGSTIGVDLVKKTLISKSSYEDVVFKDVFNSLPDNGGMVFIGPGTYEVDKITVDKPGVTVMGAGTIGLQLDAGTILKLETGKDKVFDVTAVKFTLMNLTIVGNKGATGAAYEVLVHDHAGGPADLHIYNVYILYANGYGLQLDGGHSILTGLVLEDNKNGMIVNGDDNQIIGLLSYSDDQIAVKLAGNHNNMVGGFIYTPWNALVITGTYNQVEGLKVRTAAHDGIIINGNYNTLSAPVVYNAGYSVGDYAGIRITDASYNQVIGAKVISDYTVKPNYGILEEGASDYNQILGGIIKGYNTAAVSTVGLNTVTADVLDAGAS